MDTILIVGVFVGWMLGYNWLEKRWRTFTVRGKMTASAIYLVYLTGIYVIGYHLTKIF